MSRERELIPKPRSKFLRVKCPSCGNEQIIFDRAASVVQCRICGDVLAEPTGGIARVKGEVITVLE
ncbi:MAG: 30S ribosomal protein S27e [Candidatus Bathyarchaeia archaeon]